MSDRINGLGLANGFAQGMTMMNNFYSTRDANKRANERHDREKDEWQRQDDARLVTAFQEGLESGHLDPKIAGEFGRRFDVDWSNYLDPEFGESLNVLEEAAMGKRSLYEKDFKNAFGRVFRNEISKGIGETVDDRTIKDKVLRGVYPSKDSQSLMVDLDILEETPEGERWRSAPVTTNRSAADNDVKAIPLDKALQKLKGHKMMYEGIQKTPELAAFVRQLAAKTGISSTDKSKNSESYRKYQELISLGTDPAEAKKAAYGIKGQTKDKPLVINGQLVDPNTYKVLGDFRNKKEEKPDEPLVINGQLVDRKTYKVLGDFRTKSKEKPMIVNGQMIDPETKEVIADYRTKDSKANGGMTKSNITSQIQNIAKNFHGRFNPENNVFGFSDDAAPKYTLAMERTEALINSGHSLFEAANIANLSVMDPLTPQKAEQIAENEAKERGLRWGEKDKYINGRSRELLNKQNAAIEFYKEFEQKQKANKNAKQEKPVSEKPVKQQSNAVSGKVERNVKPNPKAEEKLMSMLANANPEQHEAIKKKFLETLGYLPEGV